MGFHDRRFKEVEDRFANHYGLTLDRRFRYARKVTLSDGTMWLRGSTTQMYEVLEMALFCNAMTAFIIGGILDVELAMNYGLVLWLGAILIGNTLPNVAQNYTWLKHKRLARQKE